MVQTEGVMRIIIVAVLALSLSACETMDWSGVAEGFAAAGCESLDNCRNVCPDGTEVDYRVRNCDSPIRTGRTNPLRLEP